ncbi:MAG: hypothetical protein AB1428_05850 [Bacteroidota bacterium]
MHICRLALLAVAALPGAGMNASAQESTPQEIGRTTEKEMKVVLTSSFGSLILSRGDPEKMLLLESSRPAGRPNTTLEYSVRNRVGYLDLAIGEGAHEAEGKRGSFKISDWGGGTWHLKFSDAVPISFDVELGVGKGDFDLSGLQVKDFNLSTGASDVTLAFDEPNKSSIDNISIETGVSKFDGRNLCNANFKRFRFQGGVGAYTLDFGGTLSSEVDVDIEVGLGVLTIYVPKETGARVTYDKSWASKVDCAADFASSGDNEFMSGNYYASAGKMNIRIDSGLGSVRVRRR